VKVAYDRLAVRRESRKILFVLSDGNVSNCASSARGRAYYKRLAAAIEKQGLVEVVGIGLLSSAIRNYWKKCIVVGGSDNLSQVLFTELKKIFKI
jgi:cobalamin biosynthesis protein CobT